MLTFLTKICSAFWLRKQTNKRKLRWLPMTQGKTTMAHEALYPQPLLTPPNSPPPTPPLRSPLPAGPPASAQATCVASVPLPLLCVANSYSFSKTQASDHQETQLRASLRSRCCRRPFKTVYPDSGARQGRKETLFISVATVRTRVAEASTTRQRLVTFRGCVMNV